jgi:hypothetical protein
MRRYNQRCAPVLTSDTAGNDFIDRLPLTPMGIKEPQVLARIVAMGLAYLAVPSPYLALA